MDSRAFALRALVIGIGLWCPFLVWAEVSLGVEADNPIASAIRWRSTPPLIAPAQRSDDPCHAIKDPTVVFHDGRWHVFCTIRSAKRTHQIEYLSFTDWDQIGQARREVLKLTDGYFCAPQVFYFRSRRLWHMIYQVSDASRQPALQPAYSTSNDIADSNSWSKPILLFEKMPEGVKSWIDFWVICDDEMAHLFFTSLDGKLWRAATTRDDFPRNWSTPQVVLEADIFEASHTYRVADAAAKSYLTIVEAIADGRRYYKSYLADRLDGEWRPLADSRERPFAGPANVEFSHGRWSDSISHGELLRSANDETLPIQSGRLCFLYQGVSAAEMVGKSYGEIPWRLGILEQIGQ